ncbi:MAG: methyltransferase domain-containing protein [Patescibacteria group bacterium]
MTKPANKEFAHIFDSAASRYDAVTSAYAVSRRRDFFLRYAKGDVLEVGAGTGEMSRAFLEHGCRVVATDISPNMVDEIKKKLTIDAVVADAEHLPFPDASFDTVVGAEMVYYLDHPEVFMREAYRVLRPRGRLLLSSANDTMRIYDRLRALLRRLGIGDATYFDDKVRRFVTQRKLERFFCEANFHITEKRKAIIFLIPHLDWLSRICERTPLKYFGMFIFMAGEKK